MGIWGDGIFENDTAADFRDHFTDTIEMDLENELCAMKQDAAEYYKYWLDIPFVAALSLIHLLCLEADVSLLKSQIPKNWRDEWLKFWQIALNSEDTKPGTFKKHRDLVINTFDNLIKYIEVYRSLSEIPTPKSYLGTWHFELIDNDIGRNYIEEKITQFSLYIQSAFFEIDNDDEWWLDPEYDNKTLLAKVYLIRVLSERCDVTPPKEKSAQLWKKKYIEWINSDYDENDRQSAYYLEHLHSIEKIFDDLITVSKNWIPYHQRKPKVP
jgi:hypothetical protein